MEKNQTVGYVSLNNASVTIDNLKDENRRYDISANFNISATKINSIDSGSVIANGETAALFSGWGKNFTMNFHCEESEQSEVLAEAQEFVKKASELIANSPIAVNI